MIPEEPVGKPTLVAASAATRSGGSCLTQGDRFFISAGLALWLGALAAEAHGLWRGPSVAAIAFAAVALSWTRYVRDGETRRHGRILTALLLLALAVYQYVPPLGGASALTLGEERAWAAQILGVGLVCMWFGGIGLRIFTESIGRLSAETAGVSPPAPRIGYWLLAVYLIAAGHQFLWPLLLSPLIRLIL